MWPMIKAKKWNNIILWISRENAVRLFTGNPILFPISDLKITKDDLENGNIMIVAWETEADIVNQII